MISSTVASHVLWHYGSGGLEPGSFTKSLIHTIACADPTNRRLLAVSYRPYVEAVNAAEGDPHGIAMLAEIAGTAAS